MPRHGSSTMQPPKKKPHTHLSKAEPWLWLLVSREKTLRSLRGRVGGDEGGVKPTSGGLRQEGLEGRVIWGLLMRHLPNSSSSHRHPRAWRASLLAYLGHPASP